MLKKPNFQACWGGFAALVLPLRTLKVSASCVLAFAYFCGLSRQARLMLIPNN